MKALQNFTRWMEKNLEQPFYQAEVVRAELSRGDINRRNNESNKQMRHNKLALHVTK